MRKFLLFILLSLGIAACSTPLPPGPTTGAFPSGTTIKDAEEILFDACARAKWQITDQENGVMGIVLDHKGYHFVADIAYTARGYSIRFVEAEDPSKKVYSIYDRYAKKLAKTIQKTSINFGRRVDNSY